MISTKTIIDKANQSIAGTPTEEQVTYLTQIEDALKKDKLTVATTGDLPDVADNKGRLVYVSGEDSYYFSDGTSWSSDFSSEFQTVSSTLYAWGQGIRLGDGTTIARSSPVTVVGGLTWSSVAAGEDHNLGIANGILYAWGWNNYGFLGDGTTVDKSSPVTVIGGITNWSAASAGDDFSVGIANGVAYTWGFGTIGRLGDGTSYVSKSSPVSVVGGITNWSQVSAGEATCIGITDTGIAYGWGKNGTGMIGDGSRTNKSSPVTVVGGITNWSQVAVGDDHSLGVANGIAYSWGSNSRGQLGDHTTIWRSSPVTVIGGITNWDQVSAGESHCLGLTDTGIIYSWGRGDIGQLGDGTVINRSSPVTVAGGITNWTSVSTHAFFSLGLTGTGVLYAWGGGTAGALGTGNVSGKSSPVTVIGGITNWSQIAAGNFHSLAISSESKGFNEP